VSNLYGRYEKVLINIYRKFPVIFISIVKFYVLVPTQRILVWSEMDHINLFQNSQKLLQLTQELSGSGRIPNSLLKVRMSMIWLNTQDLVFGVLKISNTLGIYEKVQGNFHNFPEFSRKFPEIFWKIFLSIGKILC
jgi:hypothetical protein